ncbi:DUF3953 domain-containing protein [Virgibacillus xinjiangensis]|uniref:DUF3953 domain-containing protein n=1 Tax=Virgibacillus xinjiangensis TaxID=393090 RepID=A0ABV7CTT4_9BACI
MNLLNITRIISALIGGALAIYGLATGNTHLMPYMMFFLGVMLLAMGTSEIKKEKRLIGYSSVIVSFLVFSVAVEGFLYNLTS